jgi:dynein heavy chain
MASVIADVFKIGENDAQEVFRSGSQPQFEEFFKGAGPARIFVYYQTPYKVTEAGEIVDVAGHKEFFVTDGEKVKLKGKGVYFVRTAPPGKAINVASANDNEVLFGEISEHTVTSLNTIINQVYKPLVDRLEVQDWGVCEEEQKKEFTSVFDKFANELKEALKSLQTNITLEPYDRRWENEARNIHNTRVPDTQMIAEFERIFNDWSEQIQEALEGADAERKDEKDAGPRQELDYWKQRMRKLTGISEQLRSKNCRTVYDVLT